MGRGVNWKRAVFSWGLGVAIIGALFWIASNEGGAQWQRFALIATGVHLLGGALWLVATSLRVTRWRCVTSLAGSALNWRQSLFSQLRGHGISLLSPGRVADPAKVVIAARASGHDSSRLMSGLALERFAELSVILVASIVAVPLLIAGVDNTVLSAGLRRAGIIGAIALAGALVTLTLVVVVGRRRFETRENVTDVKSKMGLLILRVNGWMARFIAAFVRLPKRGWLIGVAFAGALLLVEASLMWLAAYSHGIQLGIVFAAGATALSLTIGLASLVPGGLGVQDLAGVAILSVAGGVELSLAVVIALQIRLYSFFPTLLASGIAWIMPAGEQQ